MVAFFSKVIQMVVTSLVTILAQKIPEWTMAGYDYVAAKIKRQKKIKEKEENAEALQTSKPDDAQSHFDDLVK